MLHVKSKQEMIGGVARSAENINRTPFPSPPILSSPSPFLSSSPRPPLSFRPLLTSLSSTPFPFTDEGAKRPVTVSSSPAACRAKAWSEANVTFLIFIVGGNWMFRPWMCYTAQDYNRGFGIIRHNIPKVAANNSFGILRNLTSDNKAIVFTKVLFVAGK